MTKGNASVLDALIFSELEDDLDRLTEMEKLKRLLTLKEGSIARWAVNHRHLPEEVHMTLSGQREYPEVRDKMAASIGLPREEIDRIIASAAPQPAEVGQA